MTELLQEAIAETPTLMEIERATGVTRLQLRKLRDGERSMTIRTAEPLLAYFGIEVRRRERQGAR